MTNDNESNSPSTESQGQPPPQSQVPPTTPPEGEVRAEPHKVSQSDQSTAKELAREFRWVEIGQFAVNGALAVIGIIALVIYHGQLSVMSDTLTEIRNSKTDTEKIIKAAQDQAIAASKFAESAEGIKTKTDQAVTQFQRLANATQQAASTARDAMLRGQRPWIGLAHNPTIAFEPGPGIMGATAVVLRNFGPSPALAVGYFMQPTKIPSSTDDDLKIIDSNCSMADLSTIQYKRNTFGAVIFPNTVSTVWDKREWKTFSGLVPEESFQILGCVAYLDQFSTKVIHHTTFCFKTYNTLQDFVSGKIDGEHGLLMCNFAQRVD